MPPAINQVSSSSSYGVLGLTPNSTKAEIRRAYLSLSLRYHPDKNHGRTHEIFVAIQAAYDKCIQDAERSQTERGGGTSPRPTTSHHFKSDPASPPPPPSLTSCPLDQRRTAPPEEGFPSLNDFQVPGPLTYNDVLRTHNEYLNHLAELQKVAAAINRQFLAKKLVPNHTETYRAAEYVGRWLLAETRQHKALFAFLQKTRWWQRRRAELARRQVVWYVGSVHAGEEVLHKIQHWLQSFIFRHVAERHPITMDDEQSFIQNARRYCPEDVTDRRSREEREQEFRQKTCG